MKILFAASEGVPFIKTGGLADVVGALPKELKRLNADVRVILPYYKSIPAEFRDRTEQAFCFEVNLGWRRQGVSIRRLDYEGITFYFVVFRPQLHLRFGHGRGRALRLLLPRRAGSAAEDRFCARRAALP